MSKREPTHKGILIGTSIARKKRLKVELRETANFYISEHGIRYRKRSGMPAGSNWPVYCLDLDSVEEIQQ